jgi:hypothetical protein
MRKESNERHKTSAEATKKDTISKQITTSTKKKKTLSNCESFSHVQANRNLKQQEALHYNFTPLNAEQLVNYC